MISMVTAPNTPAIKYLPTVHNSWMRYHACLESCTIESCMKHSLNTLPSQVQQWFPFVTHYCPIGSEEQEKNSSLTNMVIRSHVQRSMEEIGLDPMNNWKDCGMISSGKVVFTPPKKPIISSMASSHGSFWNYIVILRYQRMLSSLTFWYITFHQIQMDMGMQWLQQSQMWKRYGLTRPKTITVRGYKVVVKSSERYRKKKVTLVMYILRKRWSLTQSSHLGILANRFPRQSSKHSQQHTNTKPGPEIICTNRSLD